MTACKISYVASVYAHLIMIVLPNRSGDIKGRYCMNMWFSIAPIIFHPQLKHLKMFIHFKARSSKVVEKHRNIYANLELVHKPFNRCRVAYIFRLT